VFLSRINAFLPINNRGEELRHAIVTDVTKPKTMKGYLKSVVPLGLAVSLFLLGAIAWLSYRTSAEQTDTAEWVTHTHIVLERLEGLLADVVKAESARRGFVLAKDKQFLEQFSGARSAIQKAEGELRTLTADNATQQKRIDALEPLIEARIRLLEESNERLQAGDANLRLEAVVSIAGGAATKQIEALITEMENAEKELLVQRNAAARTSAERAKIILFSGTLVSFVILLGVFTLLNREVAERTRAEEKLLALAASLEHRVAERTSALEAQARTLQDQASLLDLAHDSIFVRDMTSAVQFWNRGAEETYGWTKEEALGKITHTLFQTQFPEPLAKIEAELFERGHWEGELIHTRRDGSRIVVASRWAQLREADGTPSKVLEINRDITERQRAEQEIRSLNQTLEKRVAERTAALEETNKELEAFTYSVSHDLRAPLRHVDGFSRLLLEEHGQQLSPEGKRLLDRVRQGTQHMGELVDDLLNLSRVSRREVNPLVTDLNTIVEEVITELKPTFQDRQVEFRLDRLPFAQCDPGLIRQVFANLLSNAVKFTRPRESAVIEVGQTRHNGHSAVFVRDNGVGFSMKYADKLFGVFQRLHRVEDFEGTGVGLATVQRIIQKHGGRIWVDAEIDKGATFYFTLEGLKEAVPANTGVVKERRKPQG
jgi:PAS domain S-box-containing protein